MLSTPSPSEDEHFRGHGHGRAITLAGISLIVSPGHCAVTREQGTQRCCVVLEGTPSLPSQGEVGHRGAPFMGLGDLQISGFVEFAQVDGEVPSGYPQQLLHSGKGESVPLEIAARVATTRSRVSA